MSNSNVVPDFQKTLDDRLKLVAVLQRVSRSVRDDPKVAGAELQMNTACSLVTEMIARAELDDTVNAAKRDAREKVNAAWQALHGVENAAHLAEVVERFSALTSNKYHKPCVRWDVKYMAQCDRVSGLLQTAQKWPAGNQGDLREFITGKLFPAIDAAERMYEALGRKGLSPLLAFPDPDPLGKQLARLDIRLGWLSAQVLENPEGLRKRLVELHVSADDIERIFQKLTPKEKRVRPAPAASVPNAPEELPAAEETLTVVPLVMPGDFESILARANEVVAVVQRDDVFSWVSVNGNGDPEGALLVAPIGKIASMTTTALRQAFGDRDPAVDFVRLTFEKPLPASKRVQVEKAMAPAKPERRKGRRDED